MVADETGGSDGVEKSMSDDDVVVCGGHPLASDVVRVGDCLPMVGLMTIDV